MRMLLHDCAYTPRVGNTAQKSELLITDTEKEYCTLHMRELMNKEGIILS